LTDPIFVDHFLIDGKHIVDTVRILSEAKRGAQLMPAAPNILAKNRREDSKDPEFWAWREGIVNLFGKPKFIHL